MPIMMDSAAGEYLHKMGVPEEDFNSYATHRGDHLTAQRATFANPKLFNEMVVRSDGTIKQGSKARVEPEGEVMRMWEAIETYMNRKQPLIIIAGKDYGQGSSRDWAAKGVRLAGVEAIVAEGFERIHRTNLVGMGVLPLEFKAGTDRKTLKLDGTELYSVIGNIAPRTDLTLVIERATADGVGLSAACGFRVFVPLLVMSIASLMGWFEPMKGFEWLAIPSVCIGLAVATVCEIGAYYIPWVDNALDTIATPAAMVAGTLTTMAVSSGEMSQFASWAAAIIVGGGTATAVQMGTVAVRGLSTATTGGIANPVVSTGEWIGAIVVSVLSLIVPVLVVIVGILLVRTMRKFDVEISLPSQAVESFEAEDIEQIRAKFYAINWRRLFLTQLQAADSDISFAVQDTETELYLHIQLNTQSSKAEPVFQIDSNIQLTVESKEFLGFLTRKKKYDVVYKNLNQTQVSEQLSLFLNGQIDAMTEQYRQLMHKKMLQEHRLA
ncbi:hypothetical protein FQR65_LT17424 [Abscondita terminalis]|nr:hypothetical protein FQR65_LT17424 [Abscondita terminalis]